MTVRIMVKFGKEPAVLVNAYDKRGHPVPATWPSHEAAQAYIDKHGRQWGYDALLLIEEEANGHT